MFDLFAPSLWNFSNIREISRSSPLFRTVITLFYNNYLDVALRYVVYRARRVPYDNLSLSRAWISKGDSFSFQTRFRLE